MGMGFGMCLSMGFCMDMGMSLSIWYENGYGLLFGVEYGFGLGKG